MWNGFRWFSRPWFLLLVISGILFLGRLGVREFWSPDEPRFALIAQETLKGDNPLVPHLYGEVYSNKPPLYLWLVGLFSLPWGRVTEWSARLPSALAAIASVQLTYLLGRRLLGERSGWIGAGVLLTCGHFFWRGRWASTDMTLTFFFLLSIYFLVRAVKPSGGRDGIDAGAGRWFFLGCAFATLTKGPVGLVLPVGILILTLATRRRFRDLGRFPWLTGFAVYFLVVAPWYVLYGALAGGDKFLIMTLTENVSRYLNAWNDVKPVYFYLIRFPISFLPWSLLLPAALIAASRRPPEDRDRLRFLGIWFLVLFLFFSISSGKRTVYLLPAFPAAALFMGWFLDRGYRLLGSRRLMATLVTSLAVGGTFVAAGAAITVQTPIHHPPAAGAGLAAGLILMAAAVPIAFLGWRNRLPSMAGGLGVAMILVQAVFSLWFFPRLNGYQNVRDFSSRIVEVVPPEAKFASTDKKRDAITFYTGLRNERIRDGDDLERLFQSSEPVYCLLREFEWNRDSREKNLSGTILLRESISRHTYVLVASEVSHETPTP